MCATRPENDLFGGIPQPSKAAMRSAKVFPEKHCLHCNQKLHSESRNDCCSDECRKERAKAKQAAYKKRTGKANGGGRVRQREIEKLRVTNPLAAPQSKVPYAHINHAEYVEQYVEGIGLFGNSAMAAEYATGNPSHGPGLMSHCMKNLDLKQRYNAALDAYGGRVHKTLHKLAIEGVEEPIVSMGAVVAHKRIYAEKSLLALARKFDGELRRANSAGGGATLNVQINNGMTQGQEDEEPKAVIKLSEVYRLSESERDALAAIYAKLLAIREGTASPPMLNWNPPGELIEGEAVSHEDEEPKRGN